MVLITQMEVAVNNVKKAIMIQNLMMKKRNNVKLKRINAVKKILTILILKMKRIIKNASQKYAKFLKSRESSTNTNMLQHSLQPLISPLSLDATELKILLESMENLNLRKKNVQLNLTVMSIFMYINNAELYLKKYGMVAKEDLNTQYLRTLTTISNGKEWGKIIMIIHSNVSTHA